jgi:hypothetical protein
MTTPLARSIDFERNVIDCIGAALDDFRLPLLDVGVRAEVHALPAIGSADECELRIDFLREGELIDVVEFNLYPRGAPVTTPRELATWLRTEIEGLISRAQP